MKSWMKFWIPILFEYNQTDCVKRHTVLTAKLAHLAIFASKLASNCIRISINLHNRIVRLCRALGCFNTAEAISFYGYGMR